MPLLLTTKMAISKKRFESWKENDSTIHEMFRRAGRRLPTRSLLSMVRFPSLTLNLIILAIDLQVI